METPTAEDIKSPPSYEPQSPLPQSPQSKPLPIELINCAPKGLSSTGAVLTGRVLNSLTDIISINTSTTYNDLSNTIVARGESRTKIRDVFPATKEGEGRHMVIRMLLGERSVLVDEASWEDCRALLMAGGKEVEGATLKCYYAKTPVGWEKTAKRFGRPRGESGKGRERRCVVQ